MVWRATARPASTRRSLASRLLAREGDSLPVSTETELVVRVPVDRIVLTIGIVVVSLLTIDFALQTLTELLGPPLPSWDRLVKLFNVSREQALPTWYSIIATLTCALLAVIAAARWRSGDRCRWHWTGLAAVFVAISVDEQIAAHEALTGPVRSVLNASGVLYYAWVIPALAFLVVFAGIYSRFFLALPDPFRRLFLIAALLYVGGAVGMALVGAWLADTRGVETLTYQTVATIEEVGEMSGIATLLYALLNYLRSRIGPITVNLA
jgi:hypothetical protein